MKFTSKMISKAAAPNELETIIYVSGRRIVHFNCHCILLVLVKFLHTEFATPRTFGWCYQWRRETIHMIPTITIIAEKQLVIVVGGATNRTIFTFNTLPAVAFHGYYHVWGKL